MPATQNRIIPLASVRLYDRGGGDPWLLDEGYKWHDVLSLTEERGTVDLSSDRQPTLQLMTDIGLVCRGFIVLQDTRNSHFSKSGGSWEERRPAIGAPQKYRLIQYKTTADTQWTATSTYSLPSDPAVFFSLVVLDNPATHDATTYPPLVRIEFGNNQWGIEFSRSFGARLVKNNGISATALGGYNWEAVMDLPQPETVTGSEVGEFFVGLRVHRGQICVSTDFGHNWSAYADPLFTDISVPSGSVRFAGQGGGAILGVHQMRFYTGVYTSPTRNAFATRIGAATVTYRGVAPGSTTVAMADAGSGSTAQYTATLTPQAISSVPFTFYRSPEVYAALYSHAVQRIDPSFNYTTPWDGKILTVDVNKPYELDGATASVLIRHDASTDADLEGFRFRKVEIHLGELANDGTTVTWYQVFTGYIADIRFEQSEFNKAFIALDIENATFPAKRMKWTDLTARPLGGQSANNALDMVLAQMGLSAGYRIWQPFGDTVSLPYGAAENPFLFPKCDEPFWETLRTIAKCLICEIGVTDKGWWQYVPVQYVDAQVTHTWEATPATDVTASIQRVTNEVDYRESATRVVARGFDEYGNRIMAFGRDYQAEAIPLSERFCPWIEAHIIDVPGTTTVGILSNIAVAEFMEAVAIKMEPDLTSPVRLDVPRRARVRVTGLVAGIEDNDEFVVLTLQHHYEMGMVKCVTTAGLRRLGP